MKPTPEITICWVGRSLVAACLAVSTRRRWPWRLCFGSFLRLSFLLREDYHGFFSSFSLSFSSFLSSFLSSFVVHAVTLLCDFSGELHIVVYYRIVGIWNRNQGVLHQIPGHLMVLSWYVSIFPLLCHRENNLENNQIRLALELFRSKGGGS